MSLYAEIAGDLGAQTPVVLIHGFGGSAAGWNHVRALLPDDIPVIAYDLPGHRHSLAADGRGGAGRMAKAILADLQARGISVFHLAGHSMGGAVAALIAMRAGSKVQSLTLVCPGGMGPEINAHALEHFAMATSRNELAISMAPMFAEGFDIPAALIAGLAIERAEPGAKDALTEIYAAMFAEATSSILAQGTLPMELLESLDCPATVIWGDADAILPIQQMAHMPDNFVKVRVKGAGHMLLEEAPRRVAGAIMLSI